MSKVPALRVMVSVLFPKRCACCGQVIAVADTYCAACAEQIEAIDAPCCPLCGHRKADCGCRKRRGPCDRLMAPFYYVGSIRRAVLRMKHRTDPETVMHFAEQMAAVVRRECAGESIDAVTFVPMRKHALRRRGYNQSLLLARALSERMGIPLLPLLDKRYDTPPQKALHLHARSGNVLGVFDVTAPSVKGKTVLVVDDLITTGATVGECAKMLKIYGVERVLAVALAVRKQKTDEVDE